jgi:hypothetical protein
VMECWRWSSGVVVKNPGSANVRVQFSQSALHPYSPNPLLEHAIAQLLHISLRYH